MQYTMDVQVRFHKNINREDESGLGNDVPVAMYGNVASSSSVTRRVLVEISFESHIEIPGKLGYIYGLIRLFITY